jgi:hypothetical protein
MSGPFKAIGDIGGGLIHGVTRSVGGVLKGAGQVLTGHPIEGLGTAVGGVVQGSASVVQGGLGAVKDVAGDPLVMGAAGLATFGIGGAIAAPLIGQLASGVAGNAESTVGQTFGLDGQQQMLTQDNYANYGPQNAYMAGGNVGQTAPVGGGMMPPQYGAAPGASGFC